MQQRIQAGGNEWRKAVGIIADRKISETLKGKFYDCVQCWHTYMD